MSEGRIVQIVAATPGFYAEYSGDDGESSEFAQVAAWVIVEDNDGRRWVEGIEPSGEGWDGSLAESTGNFRRYIHSHVPLDSNGMPIPPNHR